MPERGLDPVEPGRLPLVAERLIYTTNAVESLNRVIRKAIKTRGSFPSEQAAEKLIYLAIRGHEKTSRTVRGWGLFTAAGHPAADGPPRASLDGLPVIRASGAFADVDVSIWFTAQGGDAVLSSSSPLAQQEAAAAGLGIALLPVALAEADTRLAAVAYAPIPSTEIWMLASRTTLRPSRVRAFVRWCHRHFAGSSRTLAVEQAA
jgi:DNA-binding transcriptional LysR family regulator